MAVGIPFAEANLILRAPTPEDAAAGTVYDLHVHRYRDLDGNPNCISKWQFAPDELAGIVANGGVFWFHAWGATHPPVGIEGANPFVRATVAGEGEDLAAQQDKRRLALIERIGAAADLMDGKPLEGELADVAYDLLRQAAAQLSSDRLRVATAPTPAAEADEHPNAQDYRNRAERAEAECAELRADRARLDYLDRCNTALNARYGTAYGWKLIQSHNVNRLMIGDFDVDLHDSQSHGLPSCRAAIDERMRESKKVEER
ncbi:MULTISPECIES: hypothetical protein [unclassified Novosphingobium]|uniref:hypothetical protein n=1 Tax=unclassified Novosphingobium TaxID=2644732 RepID=UPI001F26E1C8|nr:MULTISPECIES: hypothetical protein [unclassified Novosphingobium]